MDDFIVQKHQNIFFVCVYEDSVLHMYCCRFQISRSRPFMGKKVKLEKKIKLYQVYYIFTYLNILLQIAVVIQYYTSLKIP